MIRKSTPQQQLIASFAIVILAGSVVLMLPGVTTQARISYVDALFTSTSAVCVTGLVVNDTGTDFTKLGQWVLLALIQVGGLGIMTFSTIFLLMVGRRPSLRQDAALEDASCSRWQRNSLAQRVTSYTGSVSFLLVTQCSCLCSMRSRPFAMQAFAYFQMVLHDIREMS
jgi:trk system potassium uptake protein TrkH